MSALSGRAARLRQKKLEEGRLRKFTSVNLDKGEGIKMLEIFTVGIATRESWLKKQQKLIHFIH